MIVLVAPELLNNFTSAYTQSQPRGIIVSITMMLYHPQNTHLITLLWHVSVLSVLPLVLLGGWSVIAHIFMKRNY